LAADIQRRCATKAWENEERIRELSRIIASKRLRRKKTFGKEYRADYFHNRPTWEIERQVSEEDEEDEYVEPAVDLQIPERAVLAEIL
jgi:hypothetical protein